MSGEENLKFLLLFVNLRVVKDSSRLTKLIEQLELKLYSLPWKT
ncbi:MAG: hypothetical protein RBG13Loki_3525 [Promethearchaeota archaeon CR_4]|nr:MAG: hypothetical protein RBG13Loki_3525 [Candidatus Lokiarchaeota archaeon CR_4]